jgi:hypothetical protein
VIRAIQLQLDPKKSQQIRLFHSHETQVALAAEIIPLLSIGKRRAPDGSRARMAAEYLPFLTTGL